MGGGQDISLMIKAGTNIVSAITSKSYLKDNSIEPKVRFADRHSLDTMAPRSVESKILTSYHLTLRFDIMAFNLYLTSMDNSYVGPDFNWSSGHKVADIDVQEGVYDLLINTVDFMNSGDEFYVFLHGLNVNKNIDSTINLIEKATHIIQLQGMDENHFPIISNDSTLKYESKFVMIEFPEPFVFQNASFCMTGFDKDYLRFSDVDSAFKIGLHQEAVRQGQMYLLDLGHLNGVWSDTVLQTTPESYNSMIQTFQTSPSSKNNYLSFGIGLISQLRGDPIYGMYTSFLSDNPDYPSHNNDTLTVFLNNTFLTENRLNLAGEVDFWENTPENGAPNKKIRGKSFYIAEGDSICFSWFYPPVKADYQIPDNSQLSIGKTAPFSCTYSANDDSSIFCYSDIDGQGNEIRHIDEYSSTYFIKQGTDILQSDTLFKFEQPYSIPGPGPFSFSITDNNFYIRGLQGELSIQNDFNLPSIDPNPPVLTSFKILNAGGMVSDVFHYNEQASLQFSAGDFIENNINHVASCNVYWKKYDDQTWTPLPTSEISEYFDSLFMYGQYFVTDLTTVLNQCTDTAYIDIKIALLDQSNNIMSETIHPAFQAIGPLVGMPDNKLNNCTLNLRVIPNPINQSSIIIFDLKETTGVTLTLYDIFGQRIKEAFFNVFDPGKNRISLDKTNFELTNLKRGIYLLKLETVKEIDACKIVIR